MRDDSGVEQSVGRVGDEICHSLGIFLKAKLIGYVSSSGVDCETKEKPKIT